MYKSDMIFRDGVEVDRSITQNYCSIQCERGNRQLPRHCRVTQFSKYRFWVRRYLRSRCSILASRIGWQAPTKIKGRSEIEFLISTKSVTHA